MKFNEAIESGFDNYSNFQGRARRSEYWFFWLFKYLVVLGIGFIGELLGSETFEGLLSVIYLLVIFLPSLSMGVRRMHDIGRSGWWVLVSVIPFIGFIWYLILCVTDGNAYTNKYGPNPKLYD